MGRIFAIFSATVIHGSPGHVINRSLVAEWLLLQAFLHPLVYELYVQIELSAFVCSLMPMHNNFVIIYPCDASLGSSGLALLIGIPGVSWLSWLLWLAQVGQWAGQVVGWLWEVSCPLYFIVF